MSINSYLGCMLGAFLLLSSCHSATNMKELKVKKISATPESAEALPALLDKEQIKFQPIDVVNWPDKYPYCPEVSFRIAHTGNAILLNYKVREETARARYGGDNEAVWTDSCVEFFLIPNQDSIYYNLECNCIGTALLGAGPNRSGREHANASVMQSISRWSSLGRKTFDERTGGVEWEVALIIPATAFFKHQIASLSGKTIPANFYKCGDELQTPHFLSWNPIAVKSPDFHLPEFFGMLLFE